jgi:hypothetical protein
LGLAKSEAPAGYRYGSLEMLDYYGEVGCCLTCSNKYEGCLCFECKCTQCSHYVSDERRCYLSLEREDKWEELKMEIDAWLKETEKAYLVVVDGEEIWVPKSLTKIESTNKDCFIVMPKWLVVEKGLYEPDEFDTWKGD